ncbi:hypothetical protein QT972_17335, partial [Microcoleus sp. herbarium7]|uniref:hypothetical protein n=1 Tax=Microcoleus sp. herbarium7 TaxID=3055435 RepID=UPI002FD78EA3
TNPTKTSSSLKKFCLAVTHFKKIRIWISDKFFQIEIEIQIPIPRRKPGTPVPDWGTKKTQNPKPKIVGGSTAW